MSAFALPPFWLVAAGMHLVPGLVWGTIAVEFWRVRSAPRSQSTLLLLLLLVSGFFTVHLLLHVAIEITPEPSSGTSTLHDVLGAVIGLLSIASGPLLLHAVVLMPLRPVPPSRAWLTMVYGSAVVAGAALLLGVGWIPDPYILLMMTLSLVRALSSLRRGAWHQGPAVAELRSPDLVVLSGTLTFGGAMLLGLFGNGMASLGSIGSVFLHTAVALGFAVPLAARMLGRVVHGVLMSATLLSATLVAYLAIPAIAARIADPGVARLVNLGGVGLVLLILVPGRALVRDAIDRMVFHRGRLRQAELLEVVAQLSPELGIAECCRRALGEVARIMQFQSAAIVLTRGRGAFAQGGFDVVTLAASWPAEGTVEILPVRPIMESMLRELPDELCAALAKTDVSRLAPIVGPRQVWGHLFATEALLAPPFSQADIEALAAFLSQLALVLDSAELRDRTIAVERSLAHAEKLAAIGELTARIAHEIRNPITAARSLAQQLAHEGGPATEEHELILAALDRVERHVAELLRFSRRDELSRTRVDLRELARRTIADLRSRLDQAGVRVALAAPAPVFAEVDAEKIRQVLVNLIENARDVLCDWRGERRLAIAITSNGDGHAHLSVSDSGPGVAADVLPSLFEPFFTCKPDGTGLGLAIVKRIVDAHGGSVRAAIAAPAGLSFTIDLPLAAE